MIRKGTYTAVLVLLTSLGGCGFREDGPDPPLENTATEVDASDMAALNRASDEPGPTENSIYQQPDLAPVIPVPDLQTGLTATGALKPVNDSGMTGALTVSDVAGGTLVSVTIGEAPSGARVLQAALHRGTCGGPGERVSVLQPIRLTGRGIGTVTDTLAIPARVVMNGAHVLVVRRLSAKVGAPPAACAAIPLNRSDPV
jgi:hypothetical protein